MAKRYKGRNRREPKPKTAQLCRDCMLSRTRALVTTEELTICTLDHNPIMPDLIACDRYEQKLKS